MSNQAFGSCPLNNFFLTFKPAMLGSWNWFKMSSIGCMHLYGGIWCILASRICFSILTMLSFYFFYLHLVSVCCVNSWHTPVEVGCIYLALLFGYWFWSMWWILFFLFKILFFLFKLVVLIILSFLSLLYLNDFCLPTIIMVYLSCWLVQSVRFDSLDMFGICCHYNSLAFLRLILLVTVCLFPLCFA